MSMWKRSFVWCVSLLCLVWCVGAPGLVGCGDPPSSEVQAEVAQDASASEAPKEPTAPGPEPSEPPDTGSGSEPGKEGPEPRPGPEPGPGSEQGPEPQPEPQPEPGPEPRPEASLPEKPLTSGNCQQSDPKCPSGYICREDVSPAVCHQQCDPAQQNACAGGALCQVQNSGEGLCVQGKAAKRNEACDPQTICGFGLVCVFSGAGSTSGTCYTRCTLDTLQSCPSGEYCFLVHSRNGVCLKGTPGSLGEGADCNTTDQCQPGLVCFAPFGGGQSKCSALCDSQRPCPNQITCRQLKGAPTGSGACFQ